MAFTLNQISPAGAAEIIGFDCSSPSSPEDFAALQQAFRDYPILCIRDQHLTPKAQADFARQWGSLESQDRSAYCHPDDHDVLILSNERRPDGSMSAYQRGGAASISLPETGEAAVSPAGTTRKRATTGKWSLTPAPGPSRHSSQGNPVEGWALRPATTTLRNEPGR